jgi:CRP/FNR family transcriptional regulator
MSDKSGRDNLVKALQETFYFAPELSPGQLDMLVEYSELENVPAGSVLVEKIGNCKGLALILSGEIKVSKVSEDGREVTLYRITKGRTCPLSAACILGNIQGYTVKVTAEVDTRILWVSKEFVSMALVQCEPFWRFVFGCMASRLYEAMEIVDSIAFIPIKKRLTQILLAKSNCGKHPIYTTHDALARELGTAREVISRELKALERAGIVSLSRGRLTVEKAQELANLT